jgi:dual specificity tyrosine-phosphorylation-regulated kinase 2/3/4
LNIQTNLHLLTAFEKKEIQKFKDVYFIGSPKSKEKRNIQLMLARGINNGFDIEAGYYKVVVGDHLLYRYEVTHELDKGAFG